MPQCHPLTVDTVMTTQFEERSQQSIEEEYRFLARDDASRLVILYDHVICSWRKGIISGT